MKNKIISRSIIAMLFAFAFSSCIQETFPTDYASDEQVSQSETALESLVKGIPASLIKQNYFANSDSWDFSMSAIIIATESMTGDLVITNATNYDHFSAWGRARLLNADGSRTKLIWHNYYRWIKTSNDLIKLIGEEPESKALKGYLGISYALRAKCYLDLVRLYEFKENKYTTGEHVKGLGVPIVTEKTTREDARNNPRAKVEDNYKMIFDDLDRAEELLKEANVTDKSQITLPVVYGLKARAYLERGTAGVGGAFEEAKKYARLAIAESGCTPLTRDEWEDPINGFNNMTANKAWMWGAPQSTEGIHNLRSFVAHMSTEESWTSYGWRVGRGINKLLYNKIPDNDFRKYSWLDPDRNKYNYKSCRPDGKNHFARNLKDYANIKFRPAQGGYSAYKVGNTADILFMRVEEMYFIEAEAAANINLSEGKKLLNQFMEYRITDGSYDCSDISTLAGFNEEIILQKRIEFWGEGIILYDMKRHGVSTTRGYKGTNSPANYRLNTEGVAPYWNFVIHESEVQNNIALEKTNNPSISEVVKEWVDK